MVCMHNAVSSLLSLLSIRQYLSFVFFIAWVKGVNWIDVWCQFAVQLGTQSQKIYLSALNICFENFYRKKESADVTFSPLNCLEKSLFSFCRESKEKSFEKMPAVKLSSPDELLSFFDDASGEKVSVEIAHSREQKSILYYLSAFTP